MNTGDLTVFAEQPEKIALAVTLTLTSGERLSGEIALNRVQKLHEFLNKPEPFVEFLTRDGRSMALAKLSIASAALIEAPRTDQLSKSAMAADPHRTLGIERAASSAAIRSAYLAKAKLYHPDQFAGNALPKEVVDYLQAMFVQVQAAYDELANSPAEREARRAANA